MKYLSNSDEVDSVIINTTRPSYLVLAELSVKYNVWY